MTLSHNLRVLRGLGQAVLNRPLYNFTALTIRTGRSFSDDVKIKDPSTTVEKQTTYSSAPKKRLGLTDHKVNRLEKYLLVWGGKYKTVSEVPDLVSQDTLERARNKARIKINLMMCAATLLGCIVMVYSGKRARDRGESVIRMNEDWHRKVNEEAALAHEKIENAKRM